MSDTRLFISHDSALWYWRTNPPQYVLEGAERNIRSLRGCPTSDAQIRDFRLSEAEFGPVPFDVIVPREASRPRSILRYHVQQAPVPPNSLYPLRDGIHIVSPTLCFVQLCKSRSLTQAAELGMELCGTYALRPDELRDKATRDYQLVDAASLQRKVHAWREAHGLALARVVSRYLVDGSASPMESKLYLLLCLPQKYGGYNIEKPELNVELELDYEDMLILRKTKVKPDFLWRNHHLIIEYDGEYHDDPLQVVRDQKRRVVLETMGYEVHVVKKQQLYDPIAFDRFARMIAGKCGIRVRSLTEKQRIARERLREELL